MLEVLIQTLMTLLLMNHIDEFSGRCQVEKESSIMRFQLFEDLMAKLLKLPIDFHDDRT